MFTDNLWSSVRMNASVPFPKSWFSHSLVKVRECCNFHNFCVQKLQAQSLHTLT